MNIERSRSFEKGGSGIEKAFRHAEIVLRRHAIDPATFTEYKDVERDVAWVKEKERTFSLDETDKLATIFEALVHQSGGQAKWFGENAFLIKTSRFDDIRNGVDEIIEFRSGPRSSSHLALAIDVTTGTALSKKMRRIRDEIDSGTLAQVKYFESLHMRMKGSISDVPRVVVGAEKETVRELVDMLLTGKKKEMAGHEVQVQLLEEIHMQLVACREYARTIGKEDLVGIYDTTIALVEDVFAEKDVVPGSMQDKFRQKDEVFATIHTHLPHYFPTREADER